MERLTWHNGEYWTQVQAQKVGTMKVGYKAICAKLAAYEDTGLEPEEILTGLDAAKRSTCEMCRKRGEEQHILCACVSCKYGGNHGH